MGFGIMLGEATDAYGKKRKADRDEEFEESQRKEVREKQTRERGIRDDVAKLPAVGTVTPVEWHDPVSGTVFKSKDEIDKYTKSLGEGAQAPSVVPVKFKTYGDADQASDLSNIYRTRGDLVTGLGVHKTALELRGLKRTDEKEEKATQAGQQYMATIAAGKEALQSFVQGDGSKLDQLGTQMAEQYNNHPAHDDGHQMKYIPGVPGQKPPMYQIMDMKSGSVVDQGPVTPQKLLGGAQEMYRQQLSAIDPKYMFENDKAEAARTTAAAAKQNADTNLKKSDSEIQMNKAHAGYFNASAGHMAAQTALINESKAGIAAAKPYLEEYSKLKPEDANGDTGRGLLMKATIASAVKTGDMSKLLAATKPSRPMNDKMQDELSKQFASEIKELDPSDKKFDAKITNITSKFRKAGLDIEPPKDAVLEALKAGQGKDPFAAASPRAVGVPKQTAPFAVVGPKDVLNAKVEQQTREIEAGQRPDYDPDIKAQLAATRQAGIQAYSEQDKQRELQRGKSLGIAR
jgi:hypothetical protein